MSKDKKTLKEMEQTVAKLAKEQEKAKEGIEKARAKYSKATQALAEAFAELQILKKGAGHE